jgi:hypothetical protein
MFDYHLIEFANLMTETSPQRQSIGIGTSPTFNYC